MIRAIILDFNGVILNDEPLHFRAMRDAVAAVGITITEEEYWNKYLPLDDSRCLTAICDNRGIQVTGSRRTQVLKAKAQLYQTMLRGEYPLFPGAPEFVRAAAHRYPLAIASGARREEIEATLNATGLFQHFAALVAAEDFTLGKPHPESFLLALATLNDRLDASSSAILPEECLVIEDAVAGVQGARAAGMACIAVSNSYPSERLAAANCVIASLGELDLDNLDALLGSRQC